MARMPHLCESWSEVSDFKALALSPLPCLSIRVTDLLARVFVKKH